MFLRRRARFWRVASRRHRHRRWRHREEFLARHGPRRPRRVVDAAAADARRVPSGGPRDAGPRAGSAGRRRREAARQRRGLPLRAEAGALARRGAAVRPCEAAHVPPCHRAADRRARAVQEAATSRAGAGRRASGRALSGSSRASSTRPTRLIGSHATHCRGSQRADGAPSCPREDMQAERRTRDEHAAAGTSDEHAAAGTSDEHAAAGTSRGRCQLTPFRHARRRRRRQQWR